MWLRFFFHFCLPEPCGWMIPNCHDHIFQYGLNAPFLLSCPPLHALLQSPRSIHRCLRILSKMKLDFNIIAPIWTNHRMSKEMSFTSVCKAATRLGASWLKVSSAQGVFYRWALDHTTTRSTKVAAKMMLMHFGEIMHQLKAVTQAPEHLDPAVQRAHDFMNWKQDAKRRKNPTRIATFLERTSAVCTPVPQYEFHSAVSTTMQRIQLRSLAKG